jgi:hypothetical protein
MRNLTRRSNPPAAKALGLCVLLALPVLASAGEQLFESGFETCVAQWPNGSVQEWNSVLAPWPAYGIGTRLSVPANGYAALRFTASSTPGQFGTLFATEFPGSTGAAQVSISRTPGCFDPAVLGPNCLSEVSGSPSVSWLVAATSLSCQLQPGESYYVNLTLGTSASGGRDLMNVLQ